MNEPTPGRWEVYPADSRYFRVEHIGQNRERFGIANVFGRDNAYENACLIALARMLNLCRQLAKGECTCKDGGPDFCCDVCEAKGIVSQVEKKNS